MTAFNQPSYMRKAKPELLSLCKDGCDFLRTLALGPKTEAYLATVMGETAFASIEQATTSRELAAAMSTTRFTAAFLPFAPLFRQYAAIEQSFARHGPASRLYTGLSALGLFHERGFSSHSSATPEIDAHLFQLKRGIAAALDATDRLNQDPISRYGIVLPSGGDHGGLKNRFESAAEKPRRHGEVERTCMGMVDAAHPMGIVFEATARAADYIAEQLPDAAVHRFNGERIVPIRPPNPRAG